MTGQLKVNWRASLTAAEAIRSPQNGKKKVKFDSANLGSKPASVKICNSHANANLAHQSHAGIFKSCIDS
jgi:hypothetical protein